MVAVDPSRRQRDRIVFIHYLNCIILTVWIGIYICFIIRWWKVCNIDGMGSNYSSHHVWNHGESFRLALGRKLLERCSR